MPNCKFYATRQDHVELLRWLFNEGKCRVFETASEFEKPLKEFFSVDAILKEFDRPHLNGVARDTVHLQLYLAEASPAFVARRLKLDPKHCNGATFRYDAEGWGLIQLYLAVPKAGWLTVSTTNHNSATRAQNWAPTYPGMAPPDAWDFKKITAFSSRLNRQIKKLGSGKIGSLVILPGAMALWQEGHTFGANYDSMVMVNPPAITGLP